MSATLHIHLLGDFLLLSDEAPVGTINVPRLQSLLAYLLLHRDAPQDRSRLAFLLWPDSTEAQAHTNLRKLVYRLRQALPNADQFLSADNHSLQWRPAPDSPWTLDVLDYEQALEQARQAEQVRDRRALRQALEQATHLYRGDLLPACYDEWILPERDRLRESFVQAAERLIMLLEQERDYEAAIAAAQQLLRHDALHETTYRQLMRLYALNGDRAAALRVYHTCAKLLERELGTEPGKATREVYESLLQSNSSPTTSTGPLTSRGTEAPLIERQDEWRQLLAAWRRAAGGQPQVVILSGEAGIGKTRLAEEMEAWVSRQGMATASARSYAAEGQLAYAPVAAWLRASALQRGIFELDPLWLAEIARLMPEALIRHPELPRPAPMSEGWQRQHFFEALARAILRTGMSHGPSGQPLLLVLDDMQWCDVETLEWLHYLLRFEAGARLMLIGTVRSEEMVPGHTLVGFLDTLRRDGLVTEIPLGPLSSAGIASLAAHIMGRQLEPAMIDRLYQETEGNPLFVVEMARAGTPEQCEQAHKAGNDARSLTRSASSLPPVIRAVLSARLAQLSPLTRDVANVAAVIGREFTFGVLAEAGGGNEDAVAQGLDELWQRRIVREHDVGMGEAYDFSHDKLREQAYTSLSPTHRHLLHRRVAEALEAVYAKNLDTVSGQIAAHYERAGLEEKAIPYYRRAGEVALRIYANADAIVAFQRAATLLEAGAREQGQWEEAAAIYMALGDIYATTGRQEEARQAYQRGMTFIPSQEAIWRARLLRKTANTWNLTSDNLLGTSHINALQGFQEAEHLLDRAADKASPAWQREWIDLQIDRLLPIRGSVDEMTAIIEKAQPVIEQYGTAEQRGLFFQAVVARDSKRNRYVITEEAIEHCREALAAAEQTTNQGLIGFGHFILGIRLLWTDHVDEAEKEMLAALDIAERTGNRTLLVRCLTFLPLIYRKRGQVVAVREIITRALSIEETRDIAIIKGHQAWIAWRDGDLTEAERYGKASLASEQRFQQNADSFRWIGMWPLIGAALAQGKIAEAIQAARILLEPTQQLPPAQLRTLLEAALSAWDEGEHEEAGSLLQEAAPIAGELGYL